MTSQFDLNGTARLAAIYVGVAGRPLASQLEVRAVAGRGLEGDRYFDGSGTWQSPGLWSEVTLVEEESVAALRRSVHFDGEASELRRNLVTRGIDLGSLVGARFRIGKVLFEGVRPCDPCGYLERLAATPGLKTALAGHGGLRARIVEGGILRVGDLVARENESPSTDATGD